MLRIPIVSGGVNTKAVKLPSLKRYCRRKNIRKLAQNAASASSTLKGMADEELVALLSLGYLLLNIETEIIRVEDKLKEVREYIKDDPEV